MLTAIIIFAAATSAEAGIFGRLSVVWNGCNPCEPVACQPCEPIACQPCPPVVCQPEPCNPCFDACGPRPFRPFGGFFANAKARLAAVHCGPVGCDPCEPVACQPCEPVCDPCAACNPCATPFLPFNGFFLNLKARLAATHCGPCVPIGCEPCEPVCEPCHPCR